MKLSSEPRERSPPAFNENAKNVTLRIVPTHTNVTSRMASGLSKRRKRWFDSIARIVPEKKIAASKPTLRNASQFPTAPSANAW